MKKIKILLSLIAPAAILGSSYVMSSCSDKPEEQSSLSNDAQEYLDTNYSSVATNYKITNEDKLDVTKNLQTTHRNIYSIYKYQSSFYNSTENKDHYYYDESTFREIWSFMKDIAEYESSSLNVTGNSLFQNIKEPNWNKDEGFRIKNLNIKYKIDGKDDLQTSVELNEIEGAKIEYVLFDFFLEHDAIGSKTGSLEFKYKIDIAKNSEVIDSLSDTYKIIDSAQFEEQVEKFEELKTNAPDINESNTINFVTYWNEILINNFEIPHIHNNVFVSISNSEVNDDKSEIKIKVLVFNESIEMTESANILFIRYTQSINDQNNNNDVISKEITFTKN
jgi:hypothetical protein